MNATKGTKATKATKANTQVNEAPLPRGSRVRPARPGAQGPASRRDEESRDDDLIDDTIEASFPASDPPSWTMGRGPATIPPLETSVRVGGPGPDGHPGRG